MICKECGEHSEFNGVISTMMACYNPIDTDGKFHDHNRNASSNMWKCKNGHEFRTRHINYCWCGWNQKEPDKHYKEYETAWSDKPLGVKFSKDVFVSDGWLEKMQNLK